MWDNISEKIKLLAKVIAWVGIISSVISGISLISQGIDLNQSSRSGRDGELFIFLGIASLIGGSIISWISSFFMYGFGELINNSEKQKILQKQLLIHFGVSEKNIEDICKEENRFMKEQGQIDMQNAIIFKEDMSYEVIKETPLNDIFEVNVGSPLTSKPNVKRLLQKEERVKINFLRDDDTVNGIWANIKNLVRDDEAVNGIWANIKTETGEVGWCLFESLKENEDKDNDGNKNEKSEYKKT